METLTIKTITSTNTKKDGTPLVGKFGPYFLVRADTEEQGNVTWFSKTAHTHKLGDKITGTLEVTTSEKDGKTYTNKNFTFPKKNEGVDHEEFRKLTNRVTTLELSFERKFEELKAQIKSDISFDTNGTFQTTEDYKKFTEPHPLTKSSEPEIDGIPLDAYKEEDMPF